MKQLVVISGKGGTGKTVISASLAALAKKVVIADCDLTQPTFTFFFVPNLKSLINLQVVRRPK